MKKYKKIAIIVTALLVLMGGAYEVYTHLNPGVGTFYPVSTPATKLYTGISSSATSARLRSLNDIYGTALTMAKFGDIGYVTFEPGTSGKEEVASFTGITDNGDGTQTITGMTRGLLSTYPFGAGGTASSHGSNTNVVFSNPGEFYNKYVVKENNETISGYWNFSALPYTSVSATNTNQFLTLGQANNIANQDAATSTEDNGGIVELATALEAASSTDGGAAKPLVLQAKYATDTPNTATRASRVLMSDLTGYLKQAWLKLSDSFAWTGAHTWSSSATFNGELISTATSTLAGSNYLSNAIKFNGVPYQFPSSGIASSTTWGFDAQGRATYFPLPIYTAGVYATTTTPNGPTIITHNVGRIPSKIKITAFFEDGASTVITSAKSVGVWIPNAYTTVYSFHGTPVNTDSDTGSTASYIIYLNDEAASQSTTATLVVTSTTFTINWTSTMSAPNGIDIMWEAE